MTSSSARVYHKRRCARDHYFKEMQCHKFLDFLVLQPTEAKRCGVARRLSLLPMRPAANLNEPTTGSIAWEVINETDQVCDPLFECPWISSAHFRIPLCAVGADQHKCYPDCDIAIGCRWRSRRQDFTPRAFMARKSSGEAGVRQLAGSAGVLERTVLQAPADL